MRTSETTSALMKALHGAQVALKNVTRDAQNPHFRSSYATLEAVLDHIRETAHQEGLAVIQTIGTGATGPAVTTRIQHVESGEWLEDVLEIPAPADAQKWGSAITYARRYSIPPLFLIATEEDDDGNAASKPGPAPRATKPTPQPAGKSGGDPDSVEGPVEAISKKFEPVWGVKVGADWFNTDDDDMKARLDSAKDDRHKVLFTWKWKQLGERKSKFITALTVFDDNGEVIGG